MKHWRAVARLITDFDIAPDGKRAVFAARGDVFTLPAKEGSARKLDAHRGNPGESQWRGRRTATGSPISPIEPEKTSSLLCRRTVKARSSNYSGYKGFKFPGVVMDSKKLAWRQGPAALVHRSGC